jgi:hypothetical protein
MRIAVDDQHFIVFALLRLLPRVRKQLRRIEFFHRYAPAAIRKEIHFRLRSKCSERPCRYRAEFSVARSGDRV